MLSKFKAFQDDASEDGSGFYTDEAHVHEYLKELVANTGIADMVTVGRKVNDRDGNKWEFQDTDYKERKELLPKWQLEMQEGITLTSP